MTTTSVQPRNGLGTAGFVLGLVGLVFSPIPFIGVVAWPLVIIGLVLAAVGWRKASRGEATNKGIAIAGVVLSLIGLAICIMWAAALDKAVDDAKRAATVHYEVTGDAKDVTISYSTYGDTMSTSQDTPATLPWAKDIQVAGFIKGGSLTVSTGAEGGSVTCKVLVDGKEEKTSTGTGPHAIVSCGGF